MKNERVKTNGRRRGFIKPFIYAILCLLCLSVLMLTACDLKWFKFNDGTAGSGTSGGQIEDGDDGDNTGDDNGGNTGDGDKTDDGDNTGTDDNVFDFICDEQNGGYILTGVLKNGEERLVIPQEYNGGKVVGVSCALFSSAASQYVFESEVIFTESEKLANVNLDGKTVYAARTAIDKIRERLYNCAYDETIRDKALTLANGAIPFGLDTDERYISFGYDWQTFNLCGGIVLPTFICKSGDSFDITAYENFEFIKRRSVADVNDLDRAYTCANGYILSDITVGDKSLLGDVVITSDSVAKLKFERVYRIYVGFGTGDYDLREAQPDFCFDTLNGERLSFRYVAERNADKFLNGVQMRSGYALNWQYSAHIDGETAEIKRLNDLSAALKEVKGDLDIYPVWTINAFDVTITSTAENNVITYGEDVTFYANTPEIDGVEFTYEWRHSGEIVGRESALELIRPSISGAYGGTYALSVGIGGSEFSSVSAYVEISLSINKRAVQVEWSDDSIVYDGKTQTPSAKAYGVIGEEIPLAVEGGGIGAGVHSALATTDSPDYELSGATIKFSIKKAKLTVKPLKCVVEYGSEPTGNGVEFSGFVGYDGENDLTGTVAYSFNNTDKHTGIYADCVSVGGLSADNYEIAYEKGALEIVPRVIQLTWHGMDNLVYDGEAHCVTAEIVNALSGDDVFVEVDGGDGVNAGLYEATARICGSDKANYRLAEDCVLIYTVAKADMPLKVASDDFVYGGECNPIVTGNPENGETSFTYFSSSGEEVTVARLAVGEYLVRAVAEATDNYDAATAVSSFRVLPREVSLQWKNYSSLTYDAKPKNVSAQIDGIFDGDSVNVEVRNGKAIDAGSYTAYAQLVGRDAFNYALPDVCTCEYEIAKCPVRIIAENKTSVYSEELEELTARVFGKIYNDEVSYSLRKETGFDAGIYAIEVVVGQYGNYDIQTVPAVYSITKCTPEIRGVQDGKLILEGYTAVGATLESVKTKLPSADVSGSWSWVDLSSRTVDKVGENSFKAKFKPADSKNYNEVELTIVINAKKVNDFNVSLGCPTETEQFIDCSTPYRIALDNGSAFVECMIWSDLSGGVQGEIKITVARNDGGAANVEIDQEFYIVYFNEAGEYLITIECSGNDEYLSSSVTAVVIVK